MSLLGAEAGRRGTVVAYGHNQWAFIGPVPLSEASLAALNQRGTVDCLIQATAFHNTFMKEAAEQFQTATIYTAKGSKKEKLPQDRLKHLPADLPATLREQVTPIAINGLRVGEEVVFLHHGSKSLVIADLMMHFPNPAPTFWTACFRRLVGWTPGARMPRLMQWMVKDRKAFTESLDSILQHPFERIITSHGEPIEENALSLLESLRRKFAQ